MSEPLRRISELSAEERRRLLADLLKKKAIAVKSYPLSFSQERLWFLDQFQPGSPLYNIPASMPAPGPLSAEVLRRALNEIVARHEVLRTTFREHDREPFQLVAPRLELRLPVVDLRGRPDLIDLVQRLTAIEARRPFDLRRGPLLRVMLLRLADQEHLFLITMHHIISDGWSGGIFYRELGQLYAAFAAGQPSPLKPLTLQYGQFAQHQRAGLGGEVLEEQLEYWRRQLTDIPSFLELPTDRARPAVQTFRGSMLAFSVGREVQATLRALAQAEDATPFMVLLTAFKVLLQRYTGTDDLLVGTPIANRTRVELEALIGFFVNTLVLRTDLAGKPTFRDLLRRVKEVTIDAYAHQDLPFAKLVEEVRPERDLSHNPLFQVMFVLQNMPTGAVSGAEAAASAPEAPAQQGLVGSGTAKFDLTLTMMEAPGGLHGWVEYDTDLFDESTIQAMVNRYQRLLEGIAAEPDASIAALPLMADEERRQLLSFCRGPHAEYERGRCVHELFSDWAARTPEATALVDAGEEISYGQLDRRANRLARHLRSLGAGPEVRVGFFLERSAEMVVTLLAILKASAVYVPLDPDDPAERLSFMIEDAGVEVLVAQDHLVKDLPPTDLPLVRTRADDETLRGLDASTPPSGASPESLAYVMYTSGSTGRPKGVAISHRAIVWLISTLTYAPITRRDRVAQASSASFDAATFEIWGALCHGASLVMVPKDVVLSPNRLAQELVGQGISTLYLTAALFSQIARLMPSAFRSLEHVIFGGDVTDPAIAARVLAQGPPRHLVHVYGPTETTTFSSAKWIETVPPRTAGLSIGRPLAETQSYLLDRNLHLVPAGIPGQLYIAGEGLARGYWDRPRLTAETFVPDPFSELPGVRMYRSGDLVRHDSGGEMIFLGRIDHQVKIRGFRVELGEIESTLARHPDVRQALVLCRTMEPGGKQIHAYVVPEAGRLQSTVELRRALRAELPGYMVPTSLILLDELPLTATGKVDRRALPSPDTSRSQLEGAYVAPRGPVEEVLVGLWEEVLGVERVGVNDNFFELGGHSLLATQLVSRIRDAFQVELPLRKVFEAPTVAEQASFLRQDSGATIEKIARVLLSLGQLSDDEVENQLRNRNPTAEGQASP